ncbi:MAG: AGE family epimerase/isomerase [Gammaproteobacteria bacterium]
MVENTIQGSMKGAVELELVEALRDEAKLLGNWMMKRALPLWSSAGMHESGAAWEALDFAGHPISADIVRVRVLARQIFVFSTGFELGFEPERCKQLVATLFDILFQHCRRNDGLFGRSYSLSKRGLVDRMFDLYDTAFALLAMARARGLLENAEVDNAIDLTLEALDKKARHSEGGYVEADAPNELRRQNPHMHLFESLLELRQSGYAGDLIPRIDSLLDFIDLKFFDQNLGIVRETTAVTDVKTAEFEPGHSMEWVRLLSLHAQSLNRDRHPLAQRLYAVALPTLDANGYACMLTSTAGVSPDPSRRLWSQTETLCAHLTMALEDSTYAKADAVKAAVKLCRGIRKDWLEPAFPGGWHDHFTAEGALIAGDMPSSTGYHLFGAIAMLLGVCELGHARDCNP